MATVNTAVVTSCSLEGFTKYGERFLKTFNEHWPVDIPLSIVSEDALTLNVEGSRAVEFLPLIECASQPVLDFYSRHASNQRVKGLQYPARYQFRYDAWKFSKKVFAIQIVAERTQADRLIWLDADVVTFADVPRRVLDGIPPYGSFSLACLDRGKYHSECGYVVYDLKHPSTLPFITEFSRLYTSDEVLCLREWHDSFVFDWLRRGSSVPTYRIPHKSQGHPFVNSILGTYMDHLKGDRKKQGVSKDHPRYRRSFYYPQKPTRKQPRLLRRQQAVVEKLDGKARGSGDPSASE